MAKNGRSGRMLTEDEERSLFEVGYRIRRIRKSLKMQQRDFAAKLNVSTPYISDIENGKVNFSLITLIRMAEVFEISMDRLVGIETTRVKLIPAEIGRLLIDCDRKTRRRYTVEYIKKNEMEEK
jgi:transcriptional regulator with XRE-family HTH domain